MSNAIPLLEGTDASGGYLVSEQYGMTLQNGIRRESAVMDLSRVDRVVGRRQKYAVYAGRPTAAFVDEGAAKGVTGAELTELTVNIKKIATIVLYTEEVLEDAREDPTVLVSADVEGAFQSLIDDHALGYAAGSAIVGSFDSELTGTSQSTELGSGGDAFAVAVSAAIEQVEDDGYKPNGIVAAADVRAHLRDARATVETATPVYTAGFGREPDTLYGLPIRYTTSLDGFPAGAGKIAAVVGDFNHAVFALRRDMTVRKSDQASVDVGGTLHHLWQQNKTGFLWEMRLGFAAHDLNKAFAKIANAS